MRSDYKMPAIALDRPAVLCFSGICHAMKSRTPQSIRLPNGNLHAGIITGIRMEDGSGKCWLLTVADYDREIFVRTE